MIESWRGLGRLLAVFGLLALAMLGLAGPAVAHSQLDRTDPADGSRVDLPPESITLTFNQNVIGLGDVVQVTGPDGNVSDGKPIVVDKQVTQPILAGSPAGKYSVLWRVTSTDGHPISGKFGFTAIAGSPEAEPEATEGAAAGPTTAAPTADASVAPNRGAAAEDKADTSLRNWLLIAVGALVVAIGAWFTTRRPGLTRADDQGSGSGPPAGEDPPPGA